MLISSFLIHYTPLAERLGNALEALKEIGLKPEVVRCWDGDKLSLVNNSESFSEETWNRTITCIYPTLLNNAGISIDSAEILFNSSTKKSNNAFMALLPPWMHPRRLSQGELSVIYKHYYAISRIAQGEEYFGLIAEDDILKKSSSAEIFQQTIGELIEANGDYIDLAGGCELRPSNPGHSCISNIYPPSTRTNACYIISKRLAKTFAENFFPVVCPIDWHLLYLMTASDLRTCYWANEECFIHGSESGAYSSWRK
jgi:hypothetical protein